MSKGPEFVRWFNRLRWRILGKPRYYNRLQWFLDEGATLEQAVHILKHEKVSAMRQRLDQYDIHGLKRKRKFNNIRQKLKKAVIEHKKKNGVF